MINACCIICHDYFEGDTVVMACPCGHTFHEECLLTWLANSATCPQCRARATQRSTIKLFFEVGSDAGDIDPSKLKNELHTLQAELKKRDTVKSALTEENQRTLNLNKTLTKKNKDLRHNLEAEQTTCDALKKQLSLLSYQIDEAKQAKKEAKRLREKLQHLERLEMVLTSSAEATESLLKEYGDGPRAAGELATYCVLLKREFQANKLNRKKLKEELDAAKKKFSNCSKNLLAKALELERVKNQLKSTEEDLRCAQEEKKNLKDRVTLLHKTMESPSGASKTALTRLIMESPAPCQFKRPELSTPENGGIIDLDDTGSPFPGNPSTPRFDEGPSPSTQAKRACHEFDLPFVKTTSLAHKNKKCKTQSEEESDALVTASIANSGLFNNRRPLSDSRSNFRKGYNGMGGHNTVFKKTVLGSFIKPSSVGKGIKKGKPATSSGKSLPNLPTLDKYL
ncbi:E3 ubiquitin-protein ligase TRAIP-like [Asterias rubens]|uniref:E3 ubiquitin-protein ligase TRAIP-like n=1 Tax=Asterias rubens TaxID=7604 RepID=UPI0014558998|nr:E3 ubiquitin-protein ligase TRAIP-like [Asterias rubens]